MDMDIAGNGVVMLRDDYVIDFTIGSPLLRFFDPRAGHHMPVQVLRLLILYQSLSVMV
jgi:hypothetical protein